MSYKEEPMKFLEQKKIAEIPNSINELNGKWRGQRKELVNWKVEH